MAARPNARTWKSGWVGVVIGLRLQRMKRNIINLDFCCTYVTVHACVYKFVYVHISNVQNLS